jgi:hypothetical protein
VARCSGGCGKFESTVGRIESAGGPATFGKGGEDATRGDSGDVNGGGCAGYGGVVVRPPTPPSVQAAVVAEGPATPEFGLSDSPENGRAPKLDGSALVGEGGVQCSISHPSVMSKNGAEKRRRS